MLADSGLVALEHPDMFEITGTGLSNREWEGYGF
jgi:hypothetical protein